MTVSSFVAAFRRLRLNQPVVNPVSDLYSVLAVMKGVSRHGREYYTEERRSENTVLFYVVRYWKVFWLVSVMSRTLTIMPSWNCRTVVMNLLGQPNVSFVFHKPSLLTVSKAFVRSAKVTKRSLFCSWLFSPTVVVETGLSYHRWSVNWIILIGRSLCGISFVVNTALHINLLEQSKKERPWKLLFILGFHSLVSHFKWLMQRVLTSGKESQMMSTHSARWSPKTRIVKNSCNVMSPAGCNVPSYACHVELLGPSPGKEQTDHFFLWR